MDTILCGISALEVLRTPPALMRTTLNAAQLNIPKGRTIRLNVRSDSPPHVRAVFAELFGSLKGVSLPVHLYAADGRKRCNRRIIWHLPRRPIESSDLIPLADGVYVTAPLRTLEDLAHCLPLSQLLKIAYEFCGLYTIVPDNRRVRFALEEIDQEANDALDSFNARDTRLAAYWDLDGSRMGFADRTGAPLPWVPCRAASGERTSLWKRPPLIYHADLIRHTEGLHNHMSRSRACNRLIRTTDLVIPGSASPAETTTAILLCGSRHLGMEGFPRPQLNRRVALSPEAARSIGCPWCVPDLVFKDDRRGKIRFVADFDSMTFHDEVSGLILGRAERRDDAARRTALQNSEYQLATITHSQIADLNRWRALVTVMARGIGIEMPQETAAFLRQRARLRAELLGGTRAHINGCVGG